MLVQGGAQVSAQLQPAVPQGSAKTKARNIRGRRVRALYKLSAARSIADNSEELPNASQDLGVDPCPSYRTNRLLRVLALGTCFVEHNARHLDGILRLAWSFLDAAPIWQVENNSGGWIDCDDCTHLAIREAQSLGQQQLRVRSATWCYDVNLILMTQTNLTTNRVRQIRCRDPFVALASKSASPAERCSGPKWQFQCGHGWADCDAEVQKLLEAAKEKGEQTMTIQGPAGFELQMDIEALTQTNMQTGRVRQLRRLVM